MSTTNLSKTHHVIVTVFLSGIITLLSPSYAKNNQNIPEAFTKGTWIFAHSSQEENLICAGQRSDSDMTKVYKFNAKTNSFEIGGYEDTTQVKILSFSEATPTSMKGKAEYTNEYYENVDVTTKNFDFMIKNNRLYSNSEFSADSYDTREKKQGLYHCIKKAK